MNQYVGQRVMLTDNMCVELKLFDGATGTDYRICGGQTCDPHESKEEASKRTALSIDENAAPHDMPTVLVQMDSSCYRGPPLSAVVGRRAHLHLDVNFCIAPHLERCTRHRDGS